MSSNVENAARDDYYSRMTRSGLTPLWNVMAQTVPHQPEPSCRPAFWNYLDVIRPALVEAGELISAKEAQRRVLILNNPSLPRGATRTLLCAMQLIKGGEIAPAHRHTQSALRLVIEGDGAYTAVNGEKTYMRPGDFIVTPAWTWHDHGKETDGSMIWLDGLDIPLVNYLGATFSEEYESPQVAETTKPDYSRARYGSGLLPLDPVTTTHYSPVFSYPYEKAREALDAMRRENEWDASHGLKMKYANPLTGGHVLPTIASFIQLLPKGFSGNSYRSTESAVVTIIEGTGRAKVGDQLYAFGPNDVFVVPNWTWVSIEADEDTVIFSYSDRATLEKLALFREQRHSTGVTT